MKIMRSPTFHRKLQCYLLVLVPFLLVVYLSFQTIRESFVVRNGFRSDDEIPLPTGVSLELLKAYKEDGLINHLKMHHLTAPAESDVPYNLSVKFPSYGEHDRYHNQLLELLKKHHKIENGFFVEAGALDGQYLSHTLDLEMKHGWNGLLVEGSPSKSKDLRSKKRKCWSADVCLTGKAYWKIDYLTRMGQEKTLWKRGNGKINPEKSGLKIRHHGKEIKDYVSEGEVECFSLFSLLSALKVKAVDLLVLDIEGYEFEVLKSYPYEEIPIKMIAVEHWLLPVTVAPETLKQFMLGKGYSLVFESTSDYVFVLDS